MSTSKFTIIIVNYHSKKYTNQLIHSLEKIRHHILEIIIVNNSPSERFRDKIYDFKINNIKNKSNLGFAKAVNIGIKASKTNIIALINPDCIIANKSILKTVDLIEKDGSIGAIGGKIIDPITKKIKFSATSKPSFLTGIFEFTNLKKIFPNNYFSKKFWYENYLNKETADVTSVCGAYTIFRKYLNKKLNLFDEEYFLYLEDIQFGLDINKLDYRVVFDNNSFVYHYSGKSNNSKYGTVLKHWYKSREIFFRKNIHPILYIILTGIFKMEEVILYLYHLAKNEPNE